MPARHEADAAGYIDELSRRFGFHLEQWTRGRTPHWARHALDPGDIVRDTLREVAGDTDGDTGSEEALVVRLRRTLYDNVRARIRLAQSDQAVALDDAPLMPESPLRDARLVPELFARYEAALKRLRPADRGAVIARAELGLPWPEVADALAKPTVSEARMTVSRALIRLAREMSHERRR